MATIRQIRDNFKGLKVNKIAMDVIVENSTDVLDYIKDQLEYGLRPDGTRIGVYASTMYEREKRAKNPKAGGWVDLKLTGATYDELTLRRTGVTVAEMYSQDEKWRGLFAKYGPNLLGLSSQSKTKFIDTTFQDAFVLKLKQALKLI